MPFGPPHDVERVERRNHRPLHHGPDPLHGPTIGNGVEHDAGQAENAVDARRQRQTACRAQRLQVVQIRTDLIAVEPPTRASGGAGRLHRDVQRAPLDVPADESLDPAVERCERVAAANRHLELPAVDAPDLRATGGVAVGGVSDPAARHAQGHGSARPAITSTRSRSPQPREPGWRQPRPSRPTRWSQLQAAQAGLRRRVQHRRPAFAPAPPDLPTRQASG